MIISICLFSFYAVKSQTSLTRALDYDGDGKVDSVVLRPKENNWYINKSSGGYAVTVAGMFPLDTPTPGDYDGDGKGDIAFWRESNGTFNYFRSSNNTFYSRSFGSIGDEPIARDYDGDGKTDLAVVRRANGYLLWYILNSTNDSISGYLYGHDTDIPVPGDYDGDGKFDFAVQRKPISGSALFYIQKSNGGSQVVTFGFFSDRVVPGDYDGDGKTDIAIVRDVGGLRDQKFEWWIMNSSNNSVVTKEFGNAELGDFPIQGDYNGDGKTDIAVWRSAVGETTNGRFYILEIGEYPFGSTGDLPVANYDVH
jgi:hypothetical protein